jgi:hypothetical protein
VANKIRIEPETLKFYVSTLTSASNLSSYNLACFICFHALNVVSRISTNYELSKIEDANVVNVQAADVSFQFTRKISATKLEML